MVLVLLLLAAGEKSPTISGTISGWNGRAGHTVRLELTGEDQIVLGGQSSIDAQGRFSMALPLDSVAAKAANSAALDQNCAGASRATKAHATTIVLRVFDQHQQAIGVLLHQTITPRADGSRDLVVHAWLAGPEELSGSCAKTKTTWKAKLVRGWNELVQRTGKAGTEVTPGPAPADDGFAFIELR